MTDTNQSLGAALNEVTEENLGVSDDAAETETTTGQSTDDIADESDSASNDEDTTEEPAADDADADEDGDGSEEPEEEEDVFDNLTPEQLQAIKADPNLNTLRKALMRSYDTKTTEIKQLVQLGEAWKQNPAQVVNALATSLGLSVTQAKAVAEAAGATADAAAAAAPAAAADPLESAGKELEALFGAELGPRVRQVFDKWADARIGSKIGTELSPVKNTLGQVVDSNEKSRMLSEENNFKSRHKDLTPELEKRIVELGQSGKYIPGRGQTPQEYLEALHDIATAQVARETAKKATGNAAKQLARKIDGNRKDREPSGVSGRGGSVKPVSKISEARSVSEALDMAEAELRSEGF